MIGWLKWTHSIASSGPRHRRVPDADPFPKQADFCSTHHASAKRPLTMLIACANTCTALESTGRTEGRFRLRRVAALAIAGAANRLRLTPKLPENFGGEPGNRTQSRASTWHLSNVPAYHLPRSPWHRDEDSNPRRLVWNQAALPGASQCEFGGWYERRTPVPCGATVFGTAGLPISHTLRVLIVGRPGET